MRTIMRQARRPTGRDPAAWGWSRSLWTTKRVQRDLGVEKTPDRGQPRPGGEEAGAVTFQPRGVGLKRTGMRTGYR